MAQGEPVAVYDAESNEEAHFVRAALEAAGVEARVTETGGMAPQIHRPQVWVDRADVDRSIPVLEEFERQVAARRPEPADGPPIEVTCEECGAVNTFLTSQHGTVQQCLQCGDYLDVGEVDTFDDWQAPGEEGPEGAEEAP